MKKLLKHTLVPHHGNDYHPHLFRKGGMVVVVGLSILVLLGGILHKVLLHSSENLAAIYAKALVVLTNEERSGSELGELSVNPLLEEAARMKALDMASKGYFAHYGPDGTAPWNWMEKAGYSYEVAGENLAIDFTDSEDVSRAWMDSPTHRANVLNAKFTEIGIATAEGEYNGHKTTFVVQMFGTPSKRNFAVVNPVAPTIVEAAATSTLPVVFTATETPPVLGAEIEKAELSKAEFIATNPGKVSRIIYSVLFTVVFLGLLCLLFIEFHRQDPKHRRNAILIIILLIACALIYEYYVRTPTRVSYEIHNSSLL